MGGRSPRRLWNGSSRSCRRRTSATSCATGSRPPSPPRPRSPHPRAREPKRPRARPSQTSVQRFSLRILVGVLRVGGETVYTGEHDGECSVTTQDTCSSLLELYISKVRIGYWKRNRIVTKENKIAHRSESRRQALVRSLARLGVAERFVVACAHEPRRRATSNWSDLCISVGV